MSLGLRKIGAVGILRESELPALGSQRRRVYDLLEDGAWHSGPEICLAAGGSEGLRRLRELRELPGTKVERLRDKPARCFFYRLIITPPEQQDEFLF